MKEYSISVDYTTLVSEWYIVKAESEEEAIQKLKNDDAEECIEREIIGGIGDDLDYEILDVEDLD